MNNEMKEKLFSQNKDNDSKNQMDQQAKIENLKHKLSLSDITLQDKDKNMKALETFKNQQREQIREAEEKINRFENWY